MEAMSIETLSIARTATVVAAVGAHAHGETLCPAVNRPDLGDNPDTSRDTVNPHNFHRPDTLGGTDTVTVHPDNATDNPPTRSAPRKRSTGLLGSEVSIHMSVPCPNAPPPELEPNNA